MRLFRKFLKYFLITFLIIILLAATLTYFFQDKLIQLTFNEINKHLSTKIEVDQNVNLSIFEKFPEISIKVKNVSVYESYPASKEKLAELKTLYFTFDAFELLKGTYVLKNIYAEKGEIKIRINENGMGNYFIFKSDTTSQSNISFDLQKIVLEDVLLSYSNDALHQDHSVHAYKVASSLKFQDKSLYIGLNGDLIIHHIGIGGNEYFKEKAIRIHCQQDYHLETNTLRIQPSELLIEGSEFKLSGTYEGNERKRINLNLRAEKSTLSTIFSLLPGNLSRNFNRYKSSGSIFFEASVKGEISAEEKPEVNVNFGFNNASFYHPDYDKKIEKATLIGSFSNGKEHNLRTSTLTLNHIRAELGGRTLTGDFALRNFEEPDLKFNLNGSLDISSILQFYPVPEVESAEGLLDINIAFAGKASDLRTQNGKANIKAEGKIGLHDIYLQWKDKPANLSHFNGILNFNKQDLDIQNLSGIIGKSDFRVHGIFKNLVSRFLSGKEHTIIEATLKSDQLDLNELMKMFPQSNASDSQGKFPYIEDYQFKINCSIGQFLIAQNDIRKIDGLIEFNHPSLLIKDLNFETAGGRIFVNGLSHLYSENRIEVNIKSELSNIYIDSIFYKCKNFNQSFLRDRNLKGQFTGNIQCSFTMDKNFNIRTETILATIDASIKNGELNDFEPMQKLSKFIDEKQLANIKFSEIRNKIYIEKNKIVIPEMEIKSNVSNISVLGTQTFNNELDYKLTVPLKTFINKRDRDEAFGAIEEDNKGNSVVFLTIKGTTSNYKIAYDTKRTGKKIREDLRKEKQEFEDLFRKKKKEQIEKQPVNQETEYFDF